MKTIRITSPKNIKITMECLDCNEEKTIEDLEEFTDCCTCGCDEYKITAIEMNARDSRSIKGDFIK